MIKLHILRHGQALHNLAASSVPAEPDSPQFKDCLLTPEGEEQARFSRVPSLSSEAQFWVSPLRRAIQTACIALPHVTKWSIIEDLRERAGRKYCDSRLKRSDLLQWLRDKCDEKIEWDAEALAGEEDMLFELERENSSKMKSRVIKLLRRLLNASDCVEFVWVSHSGLLSMFCCVLHLLPIEDRWLSNCQWKSFELDLEKIRALADGASSTFADVLPRITYSARNERSAEDTKCSKPSVTVEGADVEHCVADVLYRERIFSIKWTRWTLETLKLNSDELIIVELQAEDSGRCKMIETERLKDLAEELRARLPSHRFPEETPPFVLNGTAMFRLSFADGGSPQLDFTRIGMSHGADLVLMMRSNGECSTNLYQNLMRISSLMIADGGLKSVTILFLTC